MARLVLSLLVLSFALYMAGKAGCVSASSPADFIKASCKSTRYPDLCVQCLSGYASVISQSDRRLALVSLSVSVARARSVATFVQKLANVGGTKGRGYPAVKDCIENMGDSVDRLSQSTRELGHMGKAIGQDFMWHMSNVQTWVSAALTDQNTCLDGFAGRLMDGSVKGAIKRRVTNVARVTSNALALVNRFASRHRPAAASENP